MTLTSFEGDVLFKFLTFVAVALIGSSGVALNAQKSTGPASGALIVDGGAAGKSIRRRFVELAGGSQARIAVFVTGPSALRFGRSDTILNPDWSRDRREWTEYEEYLKDWLGVDDLRILHTRDRAVANSEAFIQPLKTATGAYFIAGNAGRYADAYLGTRTQQELKGFLDRGGIIFGSSAGAIIQGSFLVRGNPEKPLLMAPGRTVGFGFLTNVAINPHVTSAQRDAELVNVIDEYPNVLGIGIEDDAALLVRGDAFEVLGTGRVAIYDNIRRNGSWFYWLRSGDEFNLATWNKIDGNVQGDRVVRLELRRFLIPIAVVVLLIWPPWRIARKAGYSGLHQVVSCVPIANWLWLALAEWPIQRQRKRAA